MDWGAPGERRSCSSCSGQRGCYRRRSWAARTACLRPARLAPYRARSARAISASGDSDPSQQAIPTEHVSFTRSYLSQAFDDPMGLDHRAIGQQQGELLASVASDQIRIPDLPLPSSCRLHEQLVAGLMTTTVVECLEMIEVEKGNRHRLSGSQGARQLRWQSLVPGAAVGDPGQRVRPRNLAQAADQLPSLRDQPLHRQAHHRPNACPHQRPPPLTGRITRLAQQDDRCHKHHGHHDKCRRQLDPGSVERQPTDRQQDERAIPGD